MFVGEGQVLKRIMPGEVIAACALGFEFIAF
jgi:hypothetical protein